MGKNLLDINKSLKNWMLFIYFADPYSAWQRGLNEYNNKLIRHYLPKKTDFSLINNKTINMIIKKLNNRPSKLLGYKTPNEVFSTNFNQSVAFKLNLAKMT